ncbi:MAG: hypothetical protein K2N72_04525, partial [Oscillospiraceae bacterium]|nr:hypothetical protein [Oscillospiraceae bacterium]
TNPRRAAVQHRTCGECRAFMLPPVRAHRRGRAEASPLSARMIRHYLFGYRFTLFAPVRDFALTGGSMKRVTFVTHFYAAAPPDFYFFGGCEIQCFA